jgi:hypothetical protein
LASNGTVFTHNSARPSTQASRGYIQSSRMPLAVFRHQRHPGHRCERVEAAVIAGG